MSSAWSTPWAIYLTPTLALSLLVESERSPSLLRLTTSLSLLSRVLLGRPSLLRAALEQEITNRPLPKGEEVGAIGALTLRTVDHCLHSREVRLSLRSRRERADGFRWEGEH